MFICTGSIWWERSGWSKIHIPCHDQEKVCIWIWHKCVCVCVWKTQACDMHPIWKFHVIQSFMLSIWYGWLQSFMLYNQVVKCLCMHFLLKGHQSNPLITMQHLYTQLTAGSKLCASAVRTLKPTIWKVGMHSAQAKVSETSHRLQSVFLLCYFLASQSGRICQWYLNNVMLVICWTVLILNI